MDSQHGVLIDDPQIQLNRRVRKTLSQRGGSIN
jgi:hypothetical protein